MKMNCKQFLTIGGVILLVLGIVGFLEGDSKLLGDWLWFDAYENWIHTILGVVALALAYSKTPENVMKGVVALVGVLALLAGIVGFAVSGQPEPNLGGANLENPIDNLLHVVVGIWALAVVFYKKGAGAPPAV